VSPLKLWEPVARRDTVHLAERSSSRQEEDRGPAMPGEDTTSGAGSHLVPEVAQGASIPVSSAPTGMRAVMQRFRDQFGTEDSRIGNRRRARKSDDQ
jgi:hypothetical protein